MKLVRSDSGFGGSESTNQMVEEPFGIMEDLTDAVFEDMFSPETSGLELFRSDSGFGGSESTNLTVEEPFGTMEGIRGINE